MQPTAEQIDAMEQRFAREFNVHFVTITDIYENVVDGTYDVAVRYFVPGEDAPDGEYEFCSGYIWSEDGEWYLSAAPEWATY
jgi:hypothetical protein